MTAECLDALEFVEKPEYCQVWHVFPMLIVIRVRDVVVVLVGLLNVQIKRAAYLTELRDVHDVEML